ncbi:hypothetical protein CH371_04260 [Leptospira wolffii]|uniref:Uncharacterized protein n=1 Tax=Leptospira wolffii TaxID=409998 RepID=A0A2M9ZFR1_9LEPT|nr:hypothetical protein [Leptospira wolffii]PJZ67270.1 hypothetical protein CH371_04260 [Leptospira wolffii]
MLKKSFYWLVVLGFVANCSGLGEIKISHDSFRNAHIVTVKLGNRSQEKVATSFQVASFLLPTYNGTFEFSREIKTGKPNASEIQLSIIASNDNPLLTAKGAVRIGEKSFDLAVTDISGETVANMKAEAKENSITGKTSVSTSTQSYKVLRGKIVLNKEIEDLILRSNDFTLRLYSGNYPITFVIVGDDFLKLKEFLTTKPDPNQI